MFLCPHVKIQSTGIPLPSLSLLLQRFKQISTNKYQKQKHLKSSNIKQYDTRHVGELVYLNWKKRKKKMGGASGNFTFH